MPHRPLKILCIYHDSEPDWLGESPEMALEGHEVTVVHEYHQAKECIMDHSKGHPPFDVVLADMLLPWGGPTEEKDYFPACTVTLMPYVDDALIGGFGIFVPPELDTAFYFCADYAVTVSSDECRTPLGKRDWKGLLERVIQAFDGSDRYNAQPPDTGNR